jgi:hypothetical protein
MTADFERALQAVADYRPIRLRTGSFAVLYERADETGFISYVKIADSEYCGLSGCYVYDVEGIHNDLRQRAWGFHLRPTSPEEMRMSFILVRHPCAL